MEPRELATRLLEAFKASGEYVDDFGFSDEPLSVVIDGTFNLVAIAAAALGAADA